jgi:hypothetical protein
MPPNSRETFISEPITPEAGAFDPGLMRTGLASMPRAFTWRGRRYAIVECLSHTKVASREGGRAVGESYLRRQEFVVRLDTGQIARLYVERHARPGASRECAKKRWFLYTIESGGDGVR